jgi:hypothetical protein
MHQGRRGSILEQLRVLQFVRRVGKLGLGVVSIASLDALSIHILCCSEENSVESIELPPIDADKRRPLSA